MTIDEYIHIYIYMLTPGGFQVLLFEGHVLSFTMEPWPKQKPVSRLEQNRKPPMRVSNFKRHTKI